MNKRSTFSLISFLLFTSVSCMPLLENTLVNNPSSLDLDLSDNSNTFDIDDSGDFVKDFSNDQEDYVLEKPKQSLVTTGLCYQGCGNTPSNCKNVPINTFKYLTKGQRNYCLSICPIFNKKCSE